MVQATQVDLMDLMRTAIDESKQISHWDRNGEYYEREGVNWKDACKLKDRAIALFDARWQAAKAVIDLIAEELGLANRGYYLYAPGVDDSHPILDEIHEYISRSGDKAKMKKRIAELENENAVLRSLIERK
jgi:hypothetical protein